MPATPTPQCEGLAVHAPVPYAPRLTLLFEKLPVNLGAVTI
jgi:hypothetical protein